MTVPVMSPAASPTNSHYRNPPFLDIPESPNHRVKVYADDKSWLICKCHSYVFEPSLAVVYATLSLHESSCALVLLGYNYNIL